MIIRNNDERLIVIGDFRLLPGCNDVNQKDWEGLFKLQKVNDSEVKVRLYDKDKLPKGIDVISHKQNDIDFFEFAELPEKVRRDIIDNTYNIATLDLWLMNESKNSLKYIMEKRIDGIKNNEITDVKTYGKPSNHI